MGAPNTGGKKSNALAIQTDQTGKIKYDIIARQGHAKDKIVYSSINQLLPAEVLSEDAEELQRPSADEINDITESTRQALEKLTNQKIAAAMPVRSAEKSGPAQYIRYTPAQQGNGQFNSGAKQRVIRMVEAQVDPMEPPKFKINKKIPRGPPSPPGKIRFVTEEDSKLIISNFFTPSSGFAFSFKKSLSEGAKGVESAAMH